jgi:hypothetical protein
VPGRELLDWENSRARTVRPSTPESEVPRLRFRRRFHDAPRRRREEFVPIPRLAVLRVLHLEPREGQRSRVVGCVLPLGDAPFEILLAYRGEELTPAPGNSRIVEWRRMIGSKSTSRARRKPSWRTRCRAGSARLSRSSVAEGETDGAQLSERISAGRERGPVEPLADLAGLRSTRSIRYLHAVHCAIVRTSAGPDKNTLPYLNSGICADYPPRGPEVTPWRNRIGGRL